MFQVGERVSYGTEGVCLVSDIREERFSGQAVTYYVLQPVFGSSSTIFVPVHNEMLVGKMRPILTVGEIDEILAALPEATALWEDAENDRKKLYGEVLSSGDRMQIARLIKTLYLHKESLASRGKRLRMSDEHYFHEAEKLLYEEFSLILGLSREEVLPYIAECLKSRVE